MLPERFDPWWRKIRWEQIEERRRALGFLHTLHTHAGRRHWRQRRRAQLKKHYWHAVARRGDTHP
jgi:hypothetical protein